MTEEHKGSHELSSAGRRRREQMLPLLQDAVRGRVRQRRQRRVVAGSLLVMLVAFGLVELFDKSSPVLEGVDMQLADADAGLEVAPIPLETTDASDDGSLDIKSCDQAALYAQAIERSPGLFITTPDRLPASARTGEAQFVVEYLSTEELMAELSVAGMDSAVICSKQGCTLFTFGGLVENADEEVKATIRRTAQIKGMSSIFVSQPTQGAFEMASLEVADKPAHDWF